MQEVNAGSALSGGIHVHAVAILDQLCRRLAGRWQQQL